MLMSVILSSLNRLESFVPGQRPRSRPGHTSRRRLSRHLLQPKSTKNLGAQAIWVMARRGVLGDDGRRFAAEEYDAIGEALRLVDVVRHQQHGSGAIAADLAE